jgi:hypothetical protein
MSNVVRPPLVISVPMPDGERFVIIRPDIMLPRAFPPKPAETLVEAMQRVFINEPKLTEDDLRVELAAMGFDEAAVAEHIARARRARQLNDLTSWDHVTTIGFRNRDGQELLRKKDREGRTPEQRVFILRCTVCGHEYGAEGCDIYDRLCPRCQDGPPGLPT